MKPYINISFLLVFVGIFNLKGVSQERQQYFDGNDTLPYYTLDISIPEYAENEWEIGKPNKSKFDSAATLPNAIVTNLNEAYSSNTVSEFIVSIKNENALNYGIFALQWMQKIDLLDNGEDIGTIEYSTDQGNTWFSVFDSPYVYNFYGFNTENLGENTLGEKGFVGSDLDWKNVWLCFDFSWQQQASDTFLVKFSLKTGNGNTENNGWMMDNFYSHITFIHTVQEKSKNEYISVSPNPASDRIFIEAKKLKEYHLIEELSLLNEVGKQVKVWNKIPTKFWIDVKDISNGKYILNVKTNKSIESFPVIIEH